MKKKFIRKIIGALSLLVLFVTYQVCIAAFTHVHYINGVLITHSHPFKGTHSHTQSELVVIGLAPYQVTDFQSTEEICPLRPLVGYVNNEPAEHQAQLLWKEVRSLRAPPIDSLLF